MKDYEDIIYLVSCSINNITPKQKKVQKMDLETIYSICVMQRISACLYPALKNISGIDTRPWNISFSRNEKTMMLMDVERDNLYKFMDENKIWRMPLKGLIVRNFYPTPAMREMSDNDILFDKNFEDEVRKHMKKRGYKTDSDYRHIDCRKKPCYHFEIHMNCYVEGDNPIFLNYYKEIEKRLLKDDLNYSFSKEDFYVYQVCHHYNHNQSSNTGLRPLIDTYVYLKHSNLDFNYINEEMKKLQISDFELKQRNLASKLFSNPDKFPELSDEELKLFKSTMQSSAYGSTRPVLKRRVKEISESNTSIIRYIFPSFKFLKDKHIRFAKHRTLLPYYWVKYNYRRIKAYSLKGIRKEFKEYKKNTKGKKK